MVLSYQTTALLANCLIVLGAARSSQSDPTTTPNNTVGYGAVVYTTAHRTAASQVPADDESIHGRRRYQQYDTQYGLGEGASLLRSPPFRFVAVHCGYYTADNYKHSIATNAILNVLVDTVAE